MAGKQPSEAELNREFDELLEQAPDVFEQYLELLDTYPTAYMDEEWLPLPKNKMKFVFAIIMGQLHDATEIQAARAAWIMLAYFQADIGEIPLIIDGPNDDDDRYMEVSAEVHKELIERQAEADEFIATYIESDGTA